MDKIYGAIAKVYLAFDQGFLEDLCTYLQKKRVCSSVEYESDMDEPHDITAYASLFGFQIAISEKSADDTEIPQEYHYVIEIRTTDCHTELFENRVHDISLWFARYMSIYIDKTLARSTDKKMAYVFSRDRTTYERSMEIIALQ